MRVNGDLCDEFAGTVTDLVKTKQMPDRGVAVAINGVVVPRSQWSTTVVPPDANIEIVTAAAGG